MLLFSCSSSASYAVYLSIAVGWSPNSLTCMDMCAERSRIHRAYKCSFHYSFPYVPPKVTEDGWVSSLPLYPRSTNALWPYFLPFCRETAVTYTGPVTLLLVPHCLPPSAPILCSASDSLPPTPRPWPAPPRLCCPQQPGQGWW
jgi:hypothetical protein